jgi:Dienelactone hydrolase and related enzymes
MIAFAQRTITFPSLDNLPVTADLYENKRSDPYILLFHQAGYSRGEYKETAEKFVKLGYNCIAVDLRSGNEVNFIKNKTAETAIEKNLPTDYLDAKQDVQAAIEYAIKISNKTIIILGSSYSASLCLLLAKKYNQIKAVIAFSPGEYFNDANLIRDSIVGLKIPIFAASSENEFSYMQELFSKVNQSNLLLISSHYLNNSFLRSDS